MDIENHQAWIQEHIVECIANEGYVVVDISNFSDSDLRASKIELKMRHGQFSFDVTQFNSNHFIPVCINKPAPSDTLQQKVYELNISYCMTEFNSRFQACSSDSSEAEIIDAVLNDAPLNDAPNSLQPLIELIHRINTGV